MSEEPHCINCGDSRAAVREQQLICGTVDYFGELSEEYGNHRWADWNDRDLARYGILPEHAHHYRRAHVNTLPWVACEHRGEPHEFVKPSTEADEPGVCIRCFASEAEVGTK